MLPRSSFILPRLVSAAISVGVLALLALLLAVPALAQADDDQAESGSYGLRLVSDRPVPEAMTFSVRTEDGARAWAVSIPAGSSESARLAAGSAPAGTDVVLELGELPPGYELTAIDCGDDSSTNRSLYDVRSGSVSVGLDGGEDLTCSFYLDDVHARATIRVLTDDDGYGVYFPFSIAFGPDGVRELEGTLLEVPANGSFAFPGSLVGAGEHLPVTLDDPAPYYSIALAECEGDDVSASNPSVVHDDLSGVTFGLDAGEDVTCTFHLRSRLASYGFGVRVNWLLPERTTFSLAVVEPFSRPFEGSVDPPATSLLSVDGGSHHAQKAYVSDGFAGDTHRWRLAVPDRFALERIDCDDDDSSGDPATGVTDYRLSAGEHVNCTFHLVDQRAIARFMIVTDRPTPENTTFWLEMPGFQPFGRTIAGGRSATAGSLRREAGEPTAISLVDPGPGYELSEITCNDTDSGAGPGASTATYALGVAESVTCTFSLSDRRASARVRLSVPEPVPDGYSTPLNLSPGTTWGLPPSYAQLGPDQDWAFGPEMITGLHRVALTDVRPPFVLADIVCDDPDSTTPSSGDVSTGVATLGLDPGDDVLCVFELERRNPATIFLTVSTDGPIRRDFEFTLAGEFEAQPADAVVGSGLGGSTSTIATGGQIDVPANTPVGVAAHFPSLSGTPLFRVGDALVDVSALVDVPTVRSLDDYQVLTLADPGPGLEVTSIDCRESHRLDPQGLGVAGTLFSGYHTVETNPNPSFTNLPTRQVWLGVDHDEIIECTFHVGSTAVSSDAASDGDTEDDMDPPESADDHAPGDPTPKAGRWRSREVSSKIACPVPIKAQKVGTQSGRLAVKAGGDKLSGTGFGGGKKLNLKRDPERPDHYIGKAEVGDGAYKGKLSVDWTVESPERMTGTNKLSIKVRGAACTITRTFEMQHRGN